MKLFSIFSRFFKSLSVLFLALPTIAFIFNHLSKLYSNLWFRFIIKMFKIATILNAIYAAWLVFSVAAFGKAIALLLDIYYNNYNIGWDWLWQMYDTWFTDKSPRKIAKLHPRAKDPMVWLPTVSDPSPGLVVDLPDNDSFRRNYTGKFGTQHNYYAGANDTSYWYYSLYALAFVAAGVAIWYNWDSIASWFVGNPQAPGGPGGGGAPGGGGRPDTPALFGNEPSPGDAPAAVSAPTPRFMHHRTPSDTWLSRWPASARETYESLFQPRTSSSTISDEAIEITDNRSVSSSSTTPTPSTPVASSSTLVPARAPSPEALDDAAEAAQAFRGSSTTPTPYVKEVAPPYAPTASGPDATHPSGTASFTTPSTYRPRKTR